MQINMRRIIFFLTSGVVILLTFVLFFVFQLISSPRQTRAPEFSLPTPIPLDLRVKPLQSSPNVRHNKQKTEELINRVQIRQPLSPEGEIAKQKLTANLGNTSGRVFANSNVTIDYVSSPDLFQAEILSSNIASAKQDALNFMLAQGFSPSDVCYLPLSFYLNFKVASGLKNSNIIFNPLPEGC